jgi:enoyl-CoA hydratase/carnithine racemase
MLLSEMSDLVYNMINCEKPIISAINGVAVGARLVIALLADISICATDAGLGDRHVKLGAAASESAWSEVVSQPGTARSALAAGWPKPPDPSSRNRPSACPAGRPTDLQSMHSARRVCG